MPLDLVLVVVVSSLETVIVCVTTVQPSSNPLLISVLVSLDTPTSTVFCTGEPLSITNTYELPSVADFIAALATVKTSCFASSVIEAVKLICGLTRSSSESKVIVAG
jgi:hypothetical protein